MEPNIASSSRHQFKQALTVVAQKSTSSLSHESLRSLRNMVVLFLRSGMGRKAKLWIGALLTLMICINGLNVVNSYVLRDFMSAIESKDQAGFLHFAWIYFLVFVLSTVAAVYYRFSEERLGLLWRDWMTRYLTEGYIDRKIYLLGMEEFHLTNPDQRISEDVKSLTVTTLSFVLMVLNSTITVISFAGVLWGISPMLLLVAAVYAFAGSGFTILLGRPLIRLNYHQADLEANFRADLLRARQVADGIALTGYEGRVRNVLMQRISSLIQNYRRIIRINKNLGFFTTGYNYLIQLIPALVVAPLFIHRGADFGIIGQSAMAFSTLVAALSLIVTQFQTISSYASVLARLGEFAEVSRHSLAGTNLDCSTVEGRFEFQHLTLRSPLEENRVLIHDLNVKFLKGVRVLISGADHAAEQALFRAAARLHVTGSGCLNSPPRSKTVFLPENPFLPSGTLRDVLVPSDEDRTTSDEQIFSVIREVGLEIALAKHDGIEVNRNWHELLSLHEEQLFAVARAILSRPEFAFLDHIASAMGHARERQVLRLLADHGITCISFSNESPDSRIHDAWLEIREDGSWKWTDLRNRGTDA